MPHFDLHLHMKPAFHRPCRILVSSKEGVPGHVEVSLTASGVLQPDHLQVKAPDALLDAVHDASIAALQNWDDRWSHHGLDGISVSGSFASEVLSVRKFELWSPRRDTLPHRMFVSVFECLPQSACTGAVGALLETLRSYLCLQPVLWLYDEQPLRLRVLPSFGPDAGVSVGRCLAAIPEGAELIVDMSNIEFLGGMAMKLLLPFMRRDPPVRWFVSEPIAGGLMAHGVPAAQIQVDPQRPVTAEGRLRALGNWVIPDALAQLGRTASRRDVIKALRQHHAGLTVQQAANAADELLQLLAIETGSSRGSV